MSAPNSVPDPDRAFLTAPDRTADSNQRYGAARYVARGYLEGIPEFAGFALYGSTISGEQHQERVGEDTHTQISDVDGWAFFAETPALGDVEWFDSYGFRFVGEAWLSRAVAADIYRAMGMSDSEIRDQLRLDDKVDMLVVPISSRIVAETISRVAEARRVYNRMLSGDPVEPLGPEQEPDADALPDDFLLLLPQQISGLFHPDVQGTLGAWRTMVVSELSRHPDVAEDLWLEILDALEAFEGDDEFGRITLLPASFAEAQQYYGVA